MNSPNVETVLRISGLWKALNGFPGLLAIVLIFVALTRAVFSLWPPLTGLPTSVSLLMAVTVGTVLALVGYFLGNFWDDKVFDPLYKPGGRWVGRSRRPLGVFPAGDDLQRARAAAAAKVVPHASECKGVYRAAAEVARRSKVKWERIEQPLILSKFLRSLIWPLGITSVALIVIGTWQVISGAEYGAWSLYAGAGCGIIGLLMFVPYFNLRVEHMQRLYEYVAR